MTSRIGRVWWLVPLVIIVGLFALRAVVHVDPRARLSPSAAIPGDPADTRAGTGSLYVARGGPLIVGFQSNGPARLTVGAGGATREIVGQGVRTERIILPEGPLAIRFAGAPDARLVWSPVGRRGDPEYVPASSVSPDAPEHATFAAPGTNRADGFIALAVLVTLVTSLLYAARAPLAAVPNATWISMGAVLAVALVARLIDLGGAGQTWDEDVNWAAGRNYVTNVLSLDISVRAWRWNYEHPPIMKLLDGIGAQFADGFGPARALSALWSALACALLVAIGTRLYNRRTGVLAGLIAALLPSLVAHGQIVGHESPTVLWWALGVLLALCAHDGLGAAPDGVRTLRLRLAAIGCVVGIAVASRFVNGLLGPLCVAIVVINAPVAWRRATVVWLPLMVIATVVTFYCVWPRLWAGPIDALRASLAKLDTTHAPEPFLGAVTGKPPRSYFLVYLAATLPVGVLAAAALGLVRTAVDRTRTSLIALAWLVIPLGVALSPVRQDGVRYVMPCVLALVVLGAAGVDFALRRIPKHAFTAGAAALVVYLGATLVRVHPYYLDYFGEQVGGPRRVAERHWFETAWWGEGVDRAVDYVNANAAPNARVYRDCILPAHLAWFREDLWSTLSRRPEDADWIVEYVSPVSPCRIPADATKVFEVDALDAPLARVYRRP